MLSSKVEVELKQIYHRKFFLLECINKFDDEKCDQWTKMGYCNGPNHQSMFIQCKRSCGFCSKYDMMSEE